MGCEVNMDGLHPYVGETYWLNPQEHKPPTGVKLFILTCEGIALVGHWAEDARYCGWYPLLKETDEIKRLKQEMRGY